MSELHYPDLHIQGFRGIRDLTIPQLGRVTLITGKNNTGKTSVLEALRLHALKANSHVILDMLKAREELSEGMDDPENSQDPASWFSFSALFHGYPQLVESFAPIVISTKGSQEFEKLKLQVQWFRVERLPDDHLQHLVPINHPRFSDSEYAVALATETDEGTRNLTLESLLRYNRSNARVKRIDFHVNPKPTAWVSPYGGEGTSELSSLWDRIALTPLEKDVVEGLRIIDPRISAVNMVGGEGRSRRRMAKVRIDQNHQPIPLRSFGDGMNRLFAIILALVNARGGLLLVDEFENGLHYSVQLDAWRIIFRLAQELDVQVFATTHSWDTIKSFQEAASETPAEGMYLRLTRWNDGIILLDFGEDELAKATQHGMEIR